MLRVTSSGCIVLLLALVGCTKPQDYYDVFREQRATYQELTDILATIQDEKSMAEAKSKLAERFEKFDAIARKADALPKPPPREVLQRLEEDSPGMQRTIDRVREEVKRVRSLPGGKAFFKQFESQHFGLLTAVQP